MWRRPLAYGHATATKIFLGFSDPLTGANDRESPSVHPNAYSCAAEERDGQQRDEKEPVRHARAPFVRRVGGAHRWIGGALEPCRITRRPSIHLIVS